MARSPSGPRSTSPPILGWWVIAAEIDDADSRGFLNALGVRAFLAVPLLAQGKPVGLLAVDNATTGRPLSGSLQDLLVTVGTQIASAVDSARLYRTLEQRVTERTVELAEATRRAESATQAKSAFLATMSHGSDADECRHRHDQPAARYPAVG